MISSIKHQFRSKFLFWKCVAISLALHGSLLYFFSKYPLTISSSSFFLKTRPQPKEIAFDPETAVNELNKELEEVFNHIVLQQAELQEPYDLFAFQAVAPKAPGPEDFIALSPEEVTLYPVEVESSDEDLSYTENFSPIEDSTLDTYTLAPPENASSISAVEPEKATTPMQSLIAALPGVLTIDIPKQDTLPEKENPEPFALYKPQTEPSLDQELAQGYAQKDLAVPDLKTPAEGVSSIASTEKFGKKDVSTRDLITSPAPLAHERNLVVPYAPPGLSDMGDQLLFQVSSVLQWNDDFDVDVKLVPSNEEEGYIFSLALTPKYDLSSERMTQNFYFLIDRSSSIERHRFALFKRAVLKALTTLHEGDRFNILILDKKMGRLSPKNLPYNLKSMHLAEDFLEKQGQSNFFSSADLYESLETVLTEIPEGDEVHTAILLTNGQTSQSFPNQQKSLKGYLEKNRGRVSVYTAAVGQNNNLVTLDMLSSLSGGKLLYSDTNAAFPRKLSLMVKGLRCPVAKDLLISVLPSNAKANLTLLPLSSHVPALYSNEPYTIMGTVDRLSDLTLVIQGKHNDEWVSIHKLISFQNAKADSTIKKEWRIRLASQYYNDFLKEAKSKHLKEAKELLKTTHGKVAFE